MTNTTGEPIPGEGGTHANEMKLVCDDPAGGQSITFMEKDGRQVIAYSNRESGTAQELTLTDAEAADIIAWKNSGRRNSFWNWPGWDAVKNRGTSGAS